MIFHYWFFTVSSRITALRYQFCPLHLKALLVIGYLIILLYYTFSIRSSINKDQKLEQPKDSEKKEEQEPKKNEDSLFNEEDTVAMEEKTEESKKDDKKDRDRSPDSKRKV